MKIFITDGTTDAFFTAVFDAFNQKDSVITSDKSVQLSIDSEVIRTVCNTEKCERVKKGIAKYDRYAEEEITFALRSCDPLKEQVAFEYIKKLMQTKAPINKLLNMP